MDFFFFFKWTKNIWRRKKGAAGVGRHWLINRRRKNGYRDAVQIFICVKKQRGSHTSRRAPDSISILPDQITPCEITHGSGVARNGMRAPFSAKGAAAPPFKRTNEANRTTYFGWPGISRWRRFGADIAARISRAPPRSTIFRADGRST